MPAAIAVLLSFSFSPFYLHLKGRLNWIIRSEESVFFEYPHIFQGIFLTVHMCRSWSLLISLRKVMDHGPLEWSPLGPFPFFFVRLCPMEYVSIIVTMLSLYDVIVLKKGPLKIECSYSVGGDFSFIALFQQISFFQTRNVNILSPLLWTFFWKRWRHKEIAESVGNILHWAQTSKKERKRAQWRLLLEKRTK